MSQLHDNALDAIAYYEAVRDHNEANRHAVARSASPGGIADGMLTLIASLIQSLAATTGITDREATDNIRAMFLIGAGQ